MQISQAQLDTIQLIYDAALNPGQWTAILDAVVEHSGAAGAGVFVEDGTTREFDLAAVSSIFTPELLREHYAICHDAEAESYKNLLRFPAGQLFTDGDILEGVIDPDSLPGREWLRRRLGTSHRAAERILSLADGLSLASDGRPRVPIRGRQPAT